MSGISGISKISRFSPGGPDLVRSLEASGRESVIIRDEEGKNITERMKRERQRGRERESFYLSLSVLGKLERGWERGIVILDWVYGLCSLGFCNPQRS